MCANLLTVLRGRRARELQTQDAIISCGIFTFLERPLLEYKVLCKMNSL